MQPYYDEARQVFGLPWSRASLREFNRAGGNLPSFDDDELSYRFWTFDQRSNRFTFAGSDDLVSHPRCTVFTHANATRIHTDANGRRVTCVEVSSLAGRRARFHARAFVLAAGGIENPRLLLASQSHDGVGLGNENDLVGRFFMEHPHARGGKVVANDVWSLLKAFGKRRRIAGQDVAALLAPGRQLQEREGILNTSFTVAARQPAAHAQFAGMRAYHRVKHDLEPTRGSRAVWLSVKRAAHIGQKVIDPARPWLLQKLGKLEMALLVRAEQAPNPDSRVTLSRTRDALGIPRVKLDWKTSDLDIHSVERLVAAMRREMERLGLGTVDPAEWLTQDNRHWQTDRLISSHPIGGYHHMGTTRMASDPKQGVVDAQCRVHGVDNLYVAGSSVFPTSGWANPTFTIAALALRTADHIARRAADEDLPALEATQAVTQQACPN
ncbi:GMC oxidoreductase [Novosphingobium sp. P6W]|uniref:GMC oxidoreductase n=1 Tax=Novosphingobium sp. P6W TaxID=1609758 RepID=UPI000A88AC4B|nr:GMC family oxidoreductase [Novosphingobium sp. P6W]